MTIDSGVQSDLVFHGVAGIRFIAVTSVVIHACFAGVNQYKIFKD